MVSLTASQAVAQRRITKSRKKRTFSTYFLWPPVICMNVFWGQTLPSLALHTALCFFFHAWSTKSLVSFHLSSRIMMLSVLRHTKTPVKFWFLKNYLSPSFKVCLPTVMFTHSKEHHVYWLEFIHPVTRAWCGQETISHMAESYSFQYELVQYKWPRWLHQQTEKQRIIWGYKILFLDVLFPLAVDKIIFVDADQVRIRLYQHWKRYMSVYNRDLFTRVLLQVWRFDEILKLARAWVVFPLSSSQIVRADLKELKDLDLEGAPYGYTPFCDSRREMEGYRFWKSGYWSSHLGHRKYHIRYILIF